MKRVRYTKFTGDLSSSFGLEDLMQALSDFLLEGMYAHKRLSRTEERSFTAAEKKQRTNDAANYAEKIREREQEDYTAKNRTRRGFN